MTSTESESRVGELEIKLGFAEHQIEELNLALYRQQKQIDSLLREVGDLRRQIAAAAPAEGRSLRDEIPPHY